MGREARLWRLADPRRGKPSRGEIGREKNEPVSPESSLETRTAQRKLNSTLSSLQNGWGSLPFYLSHARLYRCRWCVGRATGANGKSIGIRREEVLDGRKKTLQIATLELLLCPTAFQAKNTHDHAEMRSPWRLLPLAARAHKPVRSKECMLPCDVGIRPLFKPCTCPFSFRGRARRRDERYVPVLIRRPPHPAAIACSCSRTATSSLMIWRPSPHLP